MNNIQKIDLDIRLGNEKLEVKQYAKYLGIYVDSKLTWEKKIQLLLSAFVSPYLDYDALAWEGAAKTHVNKLDRSLRQAIRLMMFKDKNILSSHFISILKYFP